MRHLDLFSGIGGFALATEMVLGKGNVEHIFCDNDPFAQAILKKHWPNSSIYGDIKTLTAKEAGGGTDLLTGGFPCQPFSAAGRRRGTEDDRHLWPHMLRLIRETHPTFVLGENVSGLLTWSNGLVFEQVCTDLENEGYEVGAFVIPAAGIGAPHRRERVWIAAHAKSAGDRGESSSVREAERGQEPRDLRERRSSDKVRNAPDSSSERRQQDPRSTYGNEGSNERRPTIQSNESSGGSEDVEDTISKRRRRRGNGNTPGTRREVQAPRRDPALREHVTYAKYNGRRSNLEVGEEEEGVAVGRNDKDATDTKTRRLRRHERSGTQEGSVARSSWREDWPAVATRLCRLDDGLPDGVARPRGWRNAALKGAGNAIVPQIAAEVIRAMLSTVG